ncbi:MAG TPA: FUSC family protein [Rhodanobacteraceae bacterium]|nr:FUSC family protein [Rhodanobacteraceae bacterium]
MNLAARLRHPLLHTLVKTQRRDVPWSVALRNTAAITLPLAVGAATGHLAAGLGVSAGALNTMFADQPGPYRLRLRRMLLTALAAGLAAFAGSILGEWRLALVFVAALWGFVAALLVALGPHATRAGLISMILLVVLGAEPLRATEAWPAAVLIFAGGVLQTLFAIAAWPLQRYRPERVAVADALRGIAALGRRAVASGEPVPLPPSLNDLHALLFGSGRARGRAVEAFQVLAELAERMRIELFALADLQAHADSDALRDDLRAVRQCAAAVLDAIAVALEQAAAPEAADALAHYRAAAESLDGHDTREDPAVHVASARTAALGGQLRAAARNAEVAGSRGELQAQRAEFALPRALRPANPLATLRANLHFSSVAFRHAVRCGLCLALALVLSHLLPLSRGYWLPMTVAIVLKPDFGATWRAGLLRVAGTLGGLVLTTALLHFGFADFWAALGLFTVLCFAYRELATVHYGIAVACLTGVVVILLSFYGIPPITSMPARAEDTALGSALALAAYFLWPTWERGRERATLARTLDAYRDYLVAVLCGDARARFEARTAARAARSNAQASLERLRQEPRSRANLPRAEALLSQANRFMRAAMALEAARTDAHDLPLPPQVAAFADACAIALREAAAGVREDRAPGEPPRLRELQRALASVLNDHASAVPAALSAALLDASDRIADAIDSLLHVLKTRTG